MRVSGSITVLCAAVGLAACGADTEDGGAGDAPRTVVVTHTVSAPQASAGKTASRKAVMPCDDEKYDTELVEKPADCSVYGNSNGVAGHSLADGAHVTNVKWESWGGTKARGTGSLRGTKLGEPLTPVAISLSGDDCGSFVVYTAMELSTRRTSFSVSLDGDCEHLSPPPDASPETKAQRDRADELEDRLDEQQRQLDRQKREIEAAKDRECRALYDAWKNSQDAVGNASDYGREAIQKYGALLCDQR